MKLKREMEKLKMIPEMKREADRLQKNEKFDAAGHIRRIIWRRQILAKINEYKRIGQHNKIPKLKSELKHIK